MDDRRGTFFGVWKTRAMKHSRHKEAKRMLDLLADEVKTMCVNHMWKVKELQEFHPQNASLYGLNINRSVIKVRLRYKSSPSKLMPYGAVRGTMLHELAHMDICPHNAEFYQLLARLEEEFKKIALSKPFAIAGRRLGVGKPPVNTKVAVAAAAVRRAKQNGTIYTRGEKLGGAKRSKGMIPSQLAGRAAELRAEGCSHCVNIIEGKVVHDNEEEMEEVKRSKEEEECQIEEQWACAECTLLNLVDASYCDACGSCRENTTADDDLTSGLPSKTNKNNGNSNDDEEVVVVEPAEVTAGVWRKENALQQQPLDIEIALESMAEEENVKKKRRHRLHDDKGRERKELNSRFQWKCCACTLLNVQMHLACSACGNERTFAQLLSHSNLNSPEETR
eukprot:242138_1